MNQRAHSRARERRQGTIRVMGNQDVDADVDETQRQNMYGAYRPRKWGRAAKAEREERASETRKRSDRQAKDRLSMTGPDRKKKLWGFSAFEIWACTGVGE